MFYALYNDSVKWNLSFCLAVKFKCHSKLFQKWCSSGVVGAFLFRKTIDFTGFSGTFQDTAVAAEENLIAEEDSPVPETNAVAEQEEGASETNLAAEQEISEPETDDAFEL